MDNGDLNINARRLHCWNSVCYAFAGAARKHNRSRVTSSSGGLAMEFHKLRRQHIGCLCQTASAAFHQWRSYQNKDGDTCCHDNKSTERNALVFLSIPSSRSTYDQPNCRSPASVCERQDGGLLTVFDRLSNRRVLGWGGPVPKSSIKSPTLCVAGEICQMVGDV